jgi:hypothetical protein
VREDERFRDCLRSRNGEGESLRLLFANNSIYMTTIHPSTTCITTTPSTNSLYIKLSHTNRPNGLYEGNEHIITREKGQEYTAKMGLLHGAEMTASYILHSVFRLIQMIMALAVCGLYGVDLNKANREHKYSDGKWVCLPSFSCLSHSPSPSLFEPKC